MCEAISHRNSLELQSIVLRWHGSTSYPRPLACLCKSSWECPGGGSKFFESGNLPSYCSRIGFLFPNGANYRPWWQIRQSTSSSSLIFDKKTRTATFNLFSGLLSGAVIVTAIQHDGYGYKYSSMKSSWPSSSCSGKEAGAKNNQSAPVVVHNTT
jgi:hypothetical protein